MNRLLQDLRIVEISAFVAAPLGGMTMAQMGAEVIRIDPIGGGIDFARWPVARDGASLYWAGLNKAKRSLALAAQGAFGMWNSRAELLCRWAEVELTPAISEERAIELTGVKEAEVLLFDLA